ncbi:AB hydrolase-1 domain-containing protein [Meloidogyne graminicola]|uniref:AB hydrolase-1 domain-containing protein n=1 Tax=Meloidogyne graminicola TaxID=189291 RepID=A0A8S9ZTD2_9BILA|nr:AB hydrolase-1 domain-containing protein [Meloidogyne graminicola]
MDMILLISAMFGPRLYRLIDQRRLYEPNILESTGNKMFAIGNCVNGIAIAMSPLIVPYILFSWSTSSYSSAAKFIAIFYFSAFVLRTCGRLTNNEYAKFIKTLDRAKNKPNSRPTSEDKKRLKRYDYEIFAAPIDFSASTIPNSKWFAPSYVQKNNLIEPFNTIRSWSSWIIANTFGRRILYPGSLTILHILAQDQLLEGRSKLLEKCGQRNILLTEDKNKIDTVFIDNRSDEENENGKTLVICCEGNAGFYEMGIMITPLNLNYSVLGWNMPGFAESTGIPKPRAVLIAMQAVMKFAINNLGFEPEQIVLFGWSIGGFPATWAAANHPNIKALILDASFDDLASLAVAKMPSFLCSFVRYTVRKYLNLPISLQLNQYQGPVLIIRRWDDEIIVTNDENDEKRRGSNRANWILIKLLKNRYPGLINDEEQEEIVHEWLSKDPQQRLMDYPPESSAEPENIPDEDELIELELEDRQRLIHQLCTKYFVDFMDATHSVPLDPLHFNIPTIVE